METRANYLLIGAFTLLAVLGALGFFVWVAQLQINRQYAYYDVLFDNVSGLSKASDVTFNGLTVGQVTGLSLYPKDPSKVLARIQVDATTPIKADTQAQMKLQGVTGTSLIEMTGGNPDSPMLRDTTFGEVPVIVAQRSIAQALSEDVPGLLAQAIEVVNGIKNLLNPDNQKAVGNILQNLDEASGKIQSTIAAFSGISSSLLGSGSGGTSPMQGLNERLDDVGGALKTTLATANDTLAVVKTTFAAAQTTLAAANDALSKAGDVAGDAGEVIDAQIPPIVQSANDTVHSVNDAVAEIRGEINTTIASVGGATNLASERLIQLGGTIDHVDATLREAQKTLQGVQSGVASAQTLIEGDGTKLVGDTRGLIATTNTSVGKLADDTRGLVANANTSVTKLVDDTRGLVANANTSVEALNQLMKVDVPAVVAQVHGAVETTNRVIDQVGSDVTGFSAQLAPLTDTAQTTLHAATKTLGDASATLKRLEASLDVADQTLTSAGSAFTTANKVIDQQVAPTAADIRTSAARLDATLADVSTNIPQITAELKATIERANGLVARVDGVVATSGPAINNFANNGLQGFVQFTQQANNLVVSLQRLTARIERDPARFILGNQPSVYGR